jgi:formate-dependent nitrite reductase cytochrome c552 subunit
MIRSLTLVVLGLALAAPVSPGPSPSRALGPRGEDPPLKLPEWWKQGDPLPVAKSNCVRCHLTAGRELTVPVRDYARSAHDLAGLSCNDCHGGDTKNDATAHEAEHGFIGTKLSAHMAACAGCHRRQAESLARSKHFWDLAKGVNRKFPACVDCHGNHDIGNPPAEFALANVCTDCHKQFASQFPHDAAVVAENDRLWKVLRQVHARNRDAADPVPEAFRREVERVRAQTARLVHRATPITVQEEGALNERARKLSDQLETWLREHP